MTSESRAVSSVFGGNLWVHRTFGDGPGSFVSAYNDCLSAFHLLPEMVLLYDEVVVPTHDFSIAAYLIHRYGAATIQRLLETKALRFQRVLGHIGYLGDGTGLTPLFVLDKESRPKPVTMAPPKALHWALRGLPVPLTDQRLRQLILHTSTEVSIDPFFDEVARATHQELEVGGVLQRTFGLNVNNPRKLPGLNGNEFRIFSRPTEEFVPDEIGVTLSVAAANVELRLFLEAGCTDSYTASPVGSLLAAKAERSFGPGESAERFAQLRELASVPDICELVATGQVQMEKILSLRESDSGAEFRKWFRGNAGKDRVQFGEALRELLRPTGLFESALTKEVRFWATNVLSVVSGPLGLAANVFDRYIIDKLKGRSTGPRFFIDSLVSAFSGKDPFVQVSQRYKKVPPAIGRFKPLDLG